MKSPKRDAVKTAIDGSTPLKKPYTTPELTVHGTVEEITKAVGMVNKDGLAGSQIG